MPQSVLAFFMVDCLRFFVGYQYLVSDTSILFLGLGNVL